MTLRNHPITGEPILFAPERASRPRAFAGDESTDRCPFCPGNETDTPPTIAAAGEPWRVRVFANKFPATEGAEVIVESPDHDATFERIAHATEAVGVAIGRYRAHAAAAYTAMFKNEGPRAGSSIAHVHSQIVPLPFLPPRVERERNAFVASAECPLCAALEDHQRDQLVIRETSSWVWLVPSASPMPYQSWIVPKRHACEIAVTSGDDAIELAQLLQSASAAMRNIGDSYNWMFMNFPRAPAAHWYIELFPRVTAIAGLELGTGTFVEIIDPAAAVRRLRD